MKRFQVHIRIGKQAIKIVTVKCNDIFNLKRIIQKYNVKLIAVKPL